MPVMIEEFTIRNNTTISYGWTLSSGYNYSSVGPITINSGVSVYVYGDWSIV